MVQDFLPHVSQISFVSPYLFLCVQFGTDYNDPCEISSTKSASKHINKLRARFKIRFMKLRCFRISEYPFSISLTINYLQRNYNSKRERKREREREGGEDKKGGGSYILVLISDNANNRRIAIDKFPMNATCVPNTTRARA